MKAFALVSLLLSLSSPQAALAQDLRHKSLRVGLSGQPNDFTVCIANQAVEAKLKETHTAPRALHSFQDSDQSPYKLASLVFSAQNKLTMRTDYFYLTLTCREPVLGWQPVQYMSGEIAPYCPAVADQASLLAVAGQAWGQIDLSACANF